MPPLQSLRSARLYQDGRSGPALTRRQLVGWSCLGRTRDLRELVGWSCLGRTRDLRELVGWSPYPRTDRSPPLAHTHTQTSASLSTTNGCSAAASPPPPATPPPATRLLRRRRLLRRLIRRRLRRLLRRRRLLQRRRLPSAAACQSWLVGPALPALSAAKGRKLVGWCPILRTVRDLTRQLSKRPGTQCVRARRGSFLMPLIAGALKRRLSYCLLNHGSC